MSVYLGSEGGVEIQRQGESIKVQLVAADVNTEARRFGLDFDPDFAGTRPSPFFTGDQVQFSSADGTTDLTLVSGMTDTNVTRWVNIDQMGGIRLYESYEEAVNGGIENALELVEPSVDQDIVVDLANVNFNCVAQMRSYELTTTRETVDMSILGEEYKQFYDQGLISGQGSISAIWDFQHVACNDDHPADSEVANYFSQLVIRFSEGARFRGMFLVYKSLTDAVWYEADCICTNVGMSFAPGQVIDSTIQFITTGQIWLRQGEPPSFLLQEQGVDSEILLEEPPGAIELEFSV